MRKDVGRCRLPELLAKQGMTQRDLANRTGLSPTQVSDFVTRRRVMSLPSAMLIAGVLHCRIDDLYEGTRRHGSGGEE